MFLSLNHYKQMCTMKYAIGILFLTMCCCSLSAQQPDLPSGCIQLTPDKMHWIDSVPNLPKGARLTVLYGDTKKAAPFAVRVKFAPNTVLKTHFHENDEVVTVLEGTVSVGFGEQGSGVVAKLFVPGSFYVNAAKVEHFVIVGSRGATIQINAMGPWTVVYK